MAEFTPKVSVLEPLVTSKVRFVVFGATLKTKSGITDTLIRKEVTPFQILASLRAEGLARFHGYCKALGSQRRTEDQN